MKNFELGNDEVVLLEDEELEYSGPYGDNLMLDKLVLTNKRLMGVWTSKKQDLKLEIALSNIKTYNGNIQADFYDSNEIGGSLRVQATDGVHYFAINSDNYTSFGESLKNAFSTKATSSKRKTIEKWIEKINEAVTGKKVVVEEPKVAPVVEKIKNEEVVKHEDMNVCSNCGKTYDKSSNFCPSCGTPTVKPQVVEVEVIRCRKCGAKMNSDAKFCPSCGTPVVEETKNAGQETVVPPSPEKKKDNKPNKCPICGEILPSDAIRCPSCGHEVRGREAVSSVKEFSEKLSSINDENKKIEAIKMFPIPNTKEDILEFMFLASSNFDAKLYATNKQGETVAGAWLTKMDQCHKKAVIMFTDPKDLEPIERIYNQVHSETKNIKKTKLIMTVSGIAAIILSLLLLMLSSGKDEAGNTTTTPLSDVSIAILAVGIIVLVLGLKKKKTNEQIEKERIEKMNKKNKK